MTLLKRLQDNARSEVTQGFREGESEIDNIDIYIQELERDISLEDFNNHVDEAIERLGSDSSDMDRPADMDPFLGPKIHQSLPLDLHLASDPEIWNYLTIVERPDFVRHRWTSYDMARFWATPNLTRNAFSILWWTAEITSEGDNYEATRKVLAKRDLALQVIDNSFSHVHPLARILGEELADEKGDVVKKVAKTLNSRLSTRVPEFMSEEELLKIVQDIKENVDVD